MVKSEGGVKSEGVKSEGGVEEWGRGGVGEG